MKYDCEACGPELGAYLLGDLDDEARAGIAAHLDGCAACRAELARDRALRDALGGLPVAACPADVSDRILAAVADEQAAGRRRDRRRAGYGMAAGLLAATVAGLLLLRPGGPLRGPAAGDYSPEQVAAARREMIETLTLTARVLDRTGRHTIVDVFSDQLPSAVEGSLRPLDDPTRGG